MRQPAKLSAWPYLRQEEEGVSLLCFMSGRVVRQALWQSMGAIGKVQGKGTTAGDEKSWGVDSGQHLAIDFKGMFLS